MTRPDRLFCVDSAKAEKAQAYGYLNCILYMAPAELNGLGKNLCPFSSTACRALCLGHYSGQAGIVSDLERGDNSTRAARRLRAQRFLKTRALFMADCVNAIEKLAYRAGSQGKKICVRMNGATDIAWEGIACKRGTTIHRNIFEAFPEIPFVDYTKNPNRFARCLPPNYHLTFSRSEENESVARELLQRGVNVAVVFGDMDAARDFWNDLSPRVVDGDAHDLRHLDPRAKNGACGYVIALSPKGRKAKNDRSGFVVR